MVSEGTQKEILDLKRDVSNCQETLLNIVHEIQNPLNILQGNLALINDIDIPMFFRQNLKI